MAMSVALAAAAEGRVPQALLRLVSPGFMASAAATGFRRLRQCAADPILQLSATLGPCP
ncbi:hypothetical protein HaLaN_09715 [Haematococcus lacustris]|uniref:Uncharacterized protein n=1 Tax=Haematococcus lacustris TaxID=44745 RepID=A0A699YVL4_HAELA|nr:hypothetical protein HaLaN_09715 [Haematococcus lacustris]